MKASSIWVTSDIRGSRPRGGILAFAVSALFLTSCLCSDEVVMKKHSPDGRFVATYVRRGCGATTSEAAHIVVKKRWSLSPARTVAVLDDPTDLDLVWLSSTNLVVRHSSGHVLQKDEPPRGVTVVFEARHQEKLR